MYVCMSVTHCETGENTLSGYYKYSKLFKVPWIYFLEPPLILNYHNISQFKTENKTKELRAECISKATTSHTNFSNVTGTNDFFFTSHRESATSTVTSHRHIRQKSSCVRI